MIIQDREYGSAKAGDRAYFIEVMRFCNTQRTHRPLTCCEYQDIDTVRDGVPIRRAIVGPTAVPVPNLGS